MTPEENIKISGDTTRLSGISVPPEKPAVAERTRASLIVLAGWEIGREVELTGPELILGRSPGAGAYISDSSVSRQHARIVREEGEEGAQFEIADLDSRNGTLVNHVPVNRQWLHNGDKIQLGDVVFKFVIQDLLDAQFHRRVHQLIHYDQLTGLLTMDAFRMAFGACVAASAGKCFSLAMTDLDGLKRVNDTYGHLAGRRVVQEMGVMIRGVLRPDDKAALYGGDETVLLFGGSSLEEAHTVMEQLRKTIEERVFEHGHQCFSVTISQGLAEWPRHGASFESLIAAADGALYAAKAGGRNCIRMVEP